MNFVDCRFKLKASTPTLTLFIDFVGVVAVGVVAVIAVVAVAFAVVVATSWPCLKS